jgi:hypothetical protein
LLVVVTTSFSCGQNDTKQKELEVKKREIALKEKEFELKHKDSINSKSSLTDKLKQKPKTEISQDLELPFIGEKYFNF